jgi:ATP diphosphatase
MTPSPAIARLVEIMAALRTPGTGCPWDLEQDFSTIAPYTIEEAYEVADAIARADFEDLRDELGDLLLQVVFHARMAEEAGLFSFGDVVEAITAKLIRRHPHVFGNGRGGDAGAVRALPTAAVNVLWDRIKAEEKAARAARRGVQEASAGVPGALGPSALEGVPTALPSLTRALKLQ